jgi:hypothetical protein
MQILNPSNRPRNSNPSAVDGFLAAVTAFRDGLFLYDAGRISWSELLRLHGMARRERALCRRGTLRRSER